MTPEQRAKLQRAIELWAGTPYMAGQCRPGVGVDCVRYVDAILQHTYDLWLPALPREAQDSAWHDPAVVSRITRLLFDRHDFFTVAPGRIWQPADWLVVRSKPQGPVSDKARETPHHCVIVGHDRRCYHAVPNLGVVGTGIGAVLATFNIIKVWRSRKGYEEPR